MNYILSVFFSLFIHTNEQYSANSIDWLCYDSQTITLIKFESYQLEHQPLFDYPDRFLINGTVLKVYKGSLMVDHPVTIYCSLNSKFEQEWKSMVGKEIFMFLKTMTINNGSAYYVEDPMMGIIDLSNPDDEAITGSFDVLKEKVAIEEYMKTCLQKLKGKTAKMAFIELLDNDGSFPVNLEGLYVPDILYPNAQKNGFR